MTTMRCEAVRDALPALARGTLPEHEAAALRAHVAECDACADAWAVVGTLAEARVAAPAGLEERVLRAVELRQTTRPRRFLGQPMRWAGLELAAAAVIALVIAWPDGVADEARTIELARAQAVVGDPFLDEELFGTTTPTEAELDGMIRVAADDVGSLPVVAVEVPADVPALAMDVGPPAGDWPGADGMAAGQMVVDVLTYEEMELLLTEMES